MKDSNCKECDKIVHSSGLCRNHYDKWLKSVNPQYRKEQSKSSTDWMKRNPHKYKEYRDRRKEKERLDPSRKLKKAKRAIMKTYNLSEEQYEALQRPCDICSKTDNPRIDHCHETNEVRGRLCHSCNVLLGHVERKDWLDKALQYLKNPPRFKKKRECV